MMTPVHRMAAVFSAKAALGPAGEEKEDEGQAGLGEWLRSRLARGFTPWERAAFWALAELALDGEDGAAGTVDGHHADAGDDHVHEDEAGQAQWPVPAALQAEKRREDEIARSEEHGEQRQSDYQRVLVHAPSLETPWPRCAHRATLYISRAVPTPPIAANGMIHNDA